jgi:hypothetical protein
MLDPGGADAEAVPPGSSMAHGKSTTSQGAAVFFDGPAAAAAAVAATDAVAHDPQPPELPVAASGQPQSPRAEDAEVPSFMEDALGRRAELDTAAALGSNDMSSSNLVNLRCWTCRHLPLVACGLTDSLLHLPRRGTAVRASNVIMCCPAGAGEQGVGRAVQ